MSIAELTPVEVVPVPQAPAGVRGPVDRRWPWWLAVTGVLAVALALRLWGIRQGLPYAYNVDENAHYVPHAIGLFGHSLDPHYFVNPPAYTYLLHVVYTAWFGGGEQTAQHFARDPTSVFLVARVVAAGLGVVAVWLLYLAGARLTDRATALLAAGLLAVSYLPVFYAHQALNDEPTLAPLCLALWGAAGIATRMRARDCLVAGVGLGLACATKYTGGVVALPILGALAVAAVAEGRWRYATTGLVLVLVVAVGAFIATDPYSLLAWHDFTGALSAQSAAADDLLGKLGLSERDGTSYYLWTLSWGLGWVPLLSAGAAIPVLLAWRPRLAAILVPAPIAFVTYMGAQSRHFGRWLLPVFPIVCLLAAAGLALLAGWAGRRDPRVRRALLVLGAIALAAQGAVHSVHSGVVLSRDDTRSEARAWLVRHVPPGSRIVVEPIVPGTWAADVGRSSPLTPTGDHWLLFSPNAVRAPGTPPFAPVASEDYERSLRPALLQTYRANGYCWIVSGSTQRGRADAQPGAVPGAIAYYAALQHSASIAARFSPYDAGTKPLKFNFDFSFDTYPLAYRRPGPTVTIWRLHGGLCSQPGTPGARA